MRAPLKSTPLLQEIQRGAPDFVHGGHSPSSRDVQHASEAELDVSRTLAGGISIALNKATPTFQDFARYSAILKDAVPPP